MGLRRNAFDVAKYKPLVFARLLQLPDRQTKWRGRSDDTLNSVFDQAFPLVEASAADGDLSRSIIGDGDVAEIETRWRARARRHWADSWAMNPQAIDPLTMWVIWQVVSILIQLWWERRKNKLGS